MRCHAGDDGLALGDDRVRPAQDGGDPDVLYRDRETPGQCAIGRRHLETPRRQTPADVESGVEVARACYWMGTEWTRRAGRSPPMAAGRDCGRTRRGRRTRRRGRRSLLAGRQHGGAGRGPRSARGHPVSTSDARGTRDGAKLDPGYLDGSADRALGRWYFKVPGIMGGDKTRAEQHLRKALTYKSDSIISLIFLAELLIDRDKSDEARASLEAALAAPIDPDGRRKTAGSRHRRAACSRASRRATLDRAPRRGVRLRASHRLSDSTDVRSCSRDPFRPLLFVALLVCVPFVARAQNPQPGIPGFPSSGAVRTRPTTPALRTIDASTD